MINSIQSLKDETICRVIICKSDFKIQVPITSLRKIHLKTKIQPSKNENFYISDKPSEG